MNHIRQNEPKSEHTPDTRENEMPYETRKVNARLNLVRMSDASLSLTDPVLDVRDRKVIDLNGREIGHVDDVLIDEKEQEVRFLQVVTGDFLGREEVRFLLPMEVVIGLRVDAVLINQARERMANAPVYDSELVPESYCEDIYSYYGYPPYWRAGYRYLSS